MKIKAQIFHGQVQEITMKIKALHGEHKTTMKIKELPGARNKIMKLMRSILIKTKKDKGALWYERNSETLDRQDLDKTKG